jgi:hypothetical protein
LYSNLEAAASAPSSRQAASSPLSRRIVPGSPRVSEHDFSPFSKLTIEQRQQMMRERYAADYWRRQGKENPYGKYLDQPTATNALIQAARDNDFDTVKDSIAHGASINIISGNIPEDFKGPADFAVINNNIPCLEYLLTIYRKKIYDDSTCSSRCEYIPKRALKYAACTGNLDAIKTIFAIVPEIITKDLLTEMLAKITQELKFPFLNDLQKMPSESVASMIRFLHEQLSAAS